MKKIIKMIKKFIKTEIIMEKLIKMKKKSCKMKNNEKI